VFSTNKAGGRTLPGLSRNSFDIEKCLAHDLAYFCGPVRVAGRNSFDIEKCLALLSFLSKAISLTPVVEIPLILKSV